MLTTSFFQAQNEPDDMVNLALLPEAKVESNMKTGSGRGIPTDVLYNPKTNQYETSSTQYNEHGLSINRSFSYHGLNDFVYSITWNEFKNVNYITFGGSYPNQDQSETLWKITSQSENGWIELDAGKGGWIDDGIYEWKSKDLIPIKTKSIKLTFYDDEDSKTTSVHLRGRGVLNRYETQDDVKATLVQYLEPEEEVFYDEILYKDKYRVLENDTVVFEHNEEQKAKNFASNTKKDNPTSVVELKQPTLIYERGEGGHTIALIKVTKSRARRVMTMNKAIKDIEYGNGCESEEVFVLVSEVPFDFKGIPVILNNANWLVAKGLLNNGEPIELMDAITKGLIVYKCLQSQVTIKR